MLEKLGHEVQVAKTGVDALQLLAGGGVDAVLMDCQMPDMDGYETTRRIRAGEVAGLNPKIPIIALTASAMEGDRQRCLDAGMNDFVTKPLSIDTLKAALDRNVAQPGVS